MTFCGDRLTALRSPPKPLLLCQPGLRHFFLFFSVTKKNFQVFLFSYLHFYFPYSFFSSNFVYLPPVSPPCGIDPLKPNRLSFILPSGFGSEACLTLPNLPDTSAIPISNTTPAMSTKSAIRSQQQHKVFMASVSAISISISFLTIPFATSPPISPHGWAPIDRQDRTRGSLHAPLTLPRFLFSPFGQIGLVAAGRTGD